MTLPLKLALGAGGVVLASAFALSGNEPPSSSIETKPQLEESAEVRAAVPTSATLRKTEKKDAAGSSGCHPSYSGCLKANASDYDCSGGSGNGPYYTGRVQVLGSDVFDLDRDNDGWGCE